MSNSDLEKRINDAISDHFDANVESASSHSRMRVYTKGNTLYCDTFFDDLENVGIKIEGVRYDTFVSSDEQSVFVVWFSELGDNTVDEKWVDPRETEVSSIIESDRFDSDEAFDSFLDTIGNGDLTTERTVRLYRACVEALRDAFSARDYFRD